MIRSVLGLQASHLLLIGTNLGYGTVLTVACARQGCGASDYYYLLRIINCGKIQHYYRQCSLEEFTKHDISLHRAG
jgi:hypothetical protein